MRLMCAAGVSLGLGLLLAFADDKKPSDADKPRADKLASIQKKYEAELGDLKKRFTNAKSAADREGIKGEARELTVLTSRDLLKLAEEDPKDKVAFDAALFIVERAGIIGSGKELEGAFAIIGEHQVDNPKVKELLPGMANGGPAGQKFLQVVGEKAKDKETQGIAFFYLGLAISEQLEEETDDKKIDALITKANEYFDKALELAKNTKVGAATISTEVSSQREGFQAIKNITVGKPVPDILGRDLAGKEVKLSSYKGKVLLMDFWFTGCGPCRAMIPHEREMVAKLEKKPFKLLSISCDAQQVALTGFLEKEAMPWDHWYDGIRGTAAKTMRVNVFPTLYLIDHTGTIRHKWIGNPGDEKLEKAIQDLISEAEKAKG